MDKGWTRAGLKQPVFPRGGWCSACGRGFTSDSAFSTHRVGPFSSRRCLADDELVAKGLEQNETGLWFTPYNGPKWWDNVSHKGFSLVELLVVVAILAILSAIAIPLFLNQKAKAQQAQMKSDARNLATEVSTARPPSGPYLGGVNAGPSLKADITAGGWVGTPQHIYMVFPNCAVTTDAVNAIKNNTTPPASPNSAELSTSGDYILLAVRSTAPGSSTWGLSRGIYDSRSGAWAWYPNSGNGFNNPYFSAEAVCVPQYGVSHWVF